MIKTRWLVLKPNEQVQDFIFHLPAEPGYELLRALLEPIIDAPLEHVWVMGADAKAPRISMFVDEAGHLKGLEFNPIATTFYRAASVLSGANPESLPAIVGPAVVFDRRVWF